MKKNRKNEAVLTLKEQFELAVMDNITRDGVKELLDWLDLETDFYEAPASTRFHGSYMGGLVEHSLNVYHQIVREAKQFAWNFNLVPAQPFNEESLAIIALFHDLCKVNTYETYLRNVKDPDSGEWYQQEQYKYGDNVFEMGHGAKSLYYVQQFIQLTDLEAQAIFWHMGAFDTSPYMTLNGLTATYGNNEYAFLLHRADYSVTCIIENANGIYEPVETAEALPAAEQPAEEPEAEEEVVEKPKPRRGRATKAKPEPEEAEEVKEEVEVLDEKPTPRRRRGAKQAAEPQTEVATSTDTDADVASTEEQPKRSRRRRGGSSSDSVSGASAEPSVERDEESSETVGAKRSRRRRGASADAEPAERESGNAIRRPRRGVAKDEAPADEEPTDIGTPYEEPEEAATEAIEADETNYDNEEAVLEEDFFWKRTDTGEVGVWREGEILPDEYDEDIHEPIDEEEYEALKKPKAKQKSRPRRRGK